MALHRQAIVLLALAAACSASARPPSPEQQMQAGRIVGQWDAHSPGCAVGVAEQGKPVLMRAYGMADLEHGVKNTTGTIVEAGSVSKQFTAAAIALPARDLLKWNENIDHPRLGDAAFWRAAQTPGTLADGSAHHYGLGLCMISPRGEPMVTHGGATADRVWDLRFERQPGRPGI